MAFTPQPPIQARQDLITALEDDLITKVQAGYAAAGMKASIHGVFSLDDLEAKQVSDLCKMIGVGIGYMGAEPTALDTNPKAALNVPHGQAVKSIDFMFLIILAVPTGAGCDERYKATDLLTVLRNSILGSVVTGARDQRTWSFVKEGPRVSESSDEVLYYAQVWRLPLPVSGNINQTKE